MTSWFGWIENTFQAGTKGRTRGRPKGEGFTTMQNISKEDFCEIIPEDIRSF